MATGGKLSNLTECSLCLHAYERPRSLPCLHSFCQVCLQEHIDKNGKADGTVYCPNCRKVATIPRGGVEEFPLNFHLNQLQEMLFKAAESDKKACQEEEPVMYCTEHSGSSLVIYCRDCEMYVCLKCVTGKHNGHTMSDLEEEATGRRQECSEIVQTLQDQLLLSERQHQEIIEYKANVCTNEDHIKDAVKKHRDLLVKHIDALADQVLSTAKDRFASEKKAVELLDERVNNLQPRLTRCISAVLELQETKNSITLMHELENLKKDIQELTNMKLNLSARRKKVTLHFHPSSLEALSPEILIGMVYGANILPELELIDNISDAEVRALAFSSDGKSLARVSFGLTGDTAIHVYDTSSYPLSGDRQVLDLGLDADAITVLPGDRLAVGVRGGKVKVVSKKGDVLCTIPKSGGEDRSMTALSDGTLAVYYPLEGRIKLFLVDSHGYRLGKVLSHFMCHSAEGLRNAHAVEFTTPRFITAYADGGFIVSDAEEGTVSAMLPDGASVEYYRKWSYCGDGGDTPFLPYAVASDSYGHVIVYCDDQELGAWGRIAILSQEGKWIRNFTSRVTDPFTKITVHSGYLAVGDGCELNIYKYMDIVKLGVKETDRAL